MIFVEVVDMLNDNDNRPEDNRMYCGCLRVDVY